MLIGEKLKTTAKRVLMSLDCSGKCHFLLVDHLMVNYQFSRFIRETERIFIF